MANTQRCKTCDALLDASCSQSDGTVLCTVCGSANKMVNTRGRRVSADGSTTSVPPSHDADKTSSLPEYTRSPHYSPNPSTQFEILFSFKGRISRSTYWLKGWLPLTGLSLLGLLIDMATAGSPGVFYYLIGILCIWPSIALLAKRCHDRNKSAWFILIMLIPYIGPVWFLIDPILLRGTVGDNRFGPDPLQVETSSVVVGASTSEEGETGA